MLYEFIVSEDSDFDTYDSEYDVYVTVCVPDENETDYYDKFYNFIVKHIPFVKKTSERTCVANWSGFIRRNLNVFRQATNDMWKPTSIPDDDDDLIYEWITEIHKWLAGYVSETEYRKFMENYANKIKEV